MADGESDSQDANEEGLASLRVKDVSLALLPLDAPAACLGVWDSHVLASFRVFVAYVHCTAITAACRLLWVLQKEAWKGSPSPRPRSALKQTDASDAASPSGRRNPRRVSFQVGGGRGTPRPCCFASAFVVEGRGVVPPFTEHPPPPSSHAIPSCIQLLGASGTSAGLPTTGPSKVSTENVSTAF